MTIEHWILGSSINNLSSSWVVIDHVLKAYWWLPQHPVTHLAQMRGIPMSHRVKKRNGPGWKHAGHCLFALKVNCYLEIKHWESHGRDCETLTWFEAAEGLSQTKCRGELGSQRKLEECIVFVLLIPRHIMFSYLLYPKTSHTTPPYSWRIWSLSHVAIHYITGFSCLLHLQIYILSCRQG